MATYDITSGVTSTGLTLNGDVMNISSGGVASDTTVDFGGRMDVYSGGTAERTTVNARGSMIVYSGTTATLITENGGYVNLYNGENVTFVSNTFSGLVLENNAPATVHEKTPATNIKLNSGGKLHVFSGGGDMKTDGANGLVGDVGKISTVGVILEDWVGYGDAIDYKQFTLGKKTSFSFSVFSEDAAKFTVWRLDGKTNKKGVTMYSLKALGTLKIAAGNVEQTQGFNLDAGNYYFSMESVNAKKGASCDYTVELASFVESDSLSAALAMPEADALADVAAFNKFATLDDASAWGSLLA